MGELNRISIDVTEPGNVDRTAWPITQGVPFADGELAVDAPVRLVDEDGRALCPYILRMEMFAGRPEIRFSHTFVFDGDPERIEVNRLGVEIDLDLGEAEQMSFGGTEGATGDAQDVRIGPAGGMTPQLLYDAVKLFGDDNPIYQEALIAIADRYVYHVNDMYEVLDVDGHEQLDPYFNAAIVAYAYERTSRLDYAADCRYYIREHFPERAQVMSFTYVCWGSIIPPCWRRCGTQSRSTGRQHFMWGRPSGSSGCVGGRPRSRSLRPRPVPSVATSVVSPDTKAEPS